MAAQQSGPAAWMSTTGGILLIDVGVLVIAYMLAGLSDDTGKIAVSVLTIVLILTLFQHSSTVSALFGG